MVDSDLVANAHVPCDLVCHVCIVPTVVSWCVGAWADVKVAVVNLACWSVLKCVAIVPLIAVCSWLSFSV